MPGFAVSLLPTFAVPEIFGVAGVIFARAMLLVLAEVFDVETYPVFDPVTVTVI